MKFTKYIALCLAVLGISTLIVTVSAVPPESSVTAVAGYCQGNTFYVFISMEDDWPDTVTAKAQVDGRTQPCAMSECPAVLKETERPVSYLLLVDCSGSMCGEQNDQHPQTLVRCFADALFDASGGKAKFAVATFDERFNNDGTDFTDNKRAFLREVNSIQYTAQRTDQAKSILEAIDYLEKYQRETGELVNLVLITDGIPDGGKDRLPLAAAAGQIDASSSILFHTFGIGTSNSASPASLKSLEQLGQGTHTSALNGRKKDAEEAACKTASLVNGLYPLQFSLGSIQNEPIDAIIYFYDQAVEAGSSVQKFTKLADISVLSSAGEVINKAEAKPIEAVDTPSAERADEDPADTPPSNQQENSESDSGAGEPAQENNEDSSANIVVAPSGKGTKESEQTDRKSFSHILIVLAVIAILVVLAGTYLLLHRKRRNSENGTNGDIYMRLETISGQFATKERNFYLADEILIGKSRSCDIVLKGPDLAKLCARIYLSDRIVYIEDIGAPDGVYLGGMRIYNGNRLRSGDEISIGNARFQFKF